MKVSLAKLRLSNIKILIAQQLDISFCPGGRKYTPLIKMNGLVAQPNGNTFLEFPANWFIVGGHHI